MPYVPPRGYGDDDDDDDEDDDDDGGGGCAKLWYESFDMCNFIAK